MKTLLAFFAGVFACYVVMSILIVKSFYDDLKGGK
jgi:hypothetical protein